MLHKTKDNVYVSTLLSSIGGLKHGFTTRITGDMRESDTVKRFLGTDKFLRPQQVHGTRVHFAGDSIENIEDDVDGLVFLGDTNMFLTVRTADCVPILAVDAKKKITGVAHSGWKGTKGNIAKTLIEEMVARGSNVQDIHVVLGPSIGPCCYDVTVDRVKLFREAFGADTKSVIERDGKTYLDLEAAISSQLATLGVQKDHVDMAHLCTASLYPEFFSYRKDTKETFGEMIGFIGFDN